MNRYPDEDRVAQEILDEARRKRRIRKGAYVQDRAGCRSTVVKVLRDGSVLAKFGIGGTITYDPKEAFKLKPVERT